MARNHAPIAAISALLFAGCAAARTGGAQTPAIPPAGPSATARSLGVPSIALPEAERRAPSPQGLASATMPAAGAPGGSHFIYTAQFYHNDLGIYGQSHALQLSFIESITQGISQPQGTMATVNGLWYVANTGDSNVLVYKTAHGGPKGPVNTLSDPYQYPGNVDATTSGQLVVVSNVTSTAGAPGTVSVYLYGNLTPTYTLSFGSDMLQGVGIAIDRHDNCYWSFNDLSTGVGSIVEFANGCQAPGNLVVSNIQTAGGVTLDQHGNLYYVDQKVGIYKCSGVSNCQPLATYFGDPVNVNFDEKQKHLWVADASGYIDAIDPRTGNLLSQTRAEGGSSDPPVGIAAAPGGGG